MSTGSFQLSKRGSTWFAAGKFPTGKPFEIDCGTGSRDVAHARAEIKVAGRLAASKGSIEMHARRKKERAASPAAPASSRPENPTISPPKPDDEELRAKLLARGAASSPPPPAEEAEPAAAPPAVEPDEVIPLSDAPKGEEQDAMTDDEAEEFAEMLAEGTVEAVERAANYVQKRRKPPHEGEAGERSKRWVCKGSAFYYRKLVGRAALSPGAMLGLGVLGMFVGVALSAEPINAGGAQAAAAPPQPAPTAPTSTNGVHTPAPQAARELAAADAASPLGTFGVQERKN